MDLFGEDITEDFEDELDEDSHDIDAAPPEDALTPKTLVSLLGHESQASALLEAYNDNRMPHGIILSGPKGIGKSTFAYQLAKFLLTHGLKDQAQGGFFGDDPAPATLQVDPQSQAVRLVHAGAHPDLLVIEPEYDAAKDRRKDNISVSEIRKVPPFLTKTASMGGWRVVVIDDADTMNRNAQNALLKVLEEPPKNTVLLLVVHRSGMMIPTIRSRSRTIHFGALPETEFSKILSQHGHMLGRLEEQSLYTMTKGSAGGALAFLEGGGMQTLKELLSMFDSYPRWSWPEIHTLSERMARGGQDNSYEHFTRLLPWIMGQLIKAKARGQSLQTGQIADSEPLQAMMRHSSLESLLKICENLEELFARVSKSNLDKRQAVLSAFSLLAA